MTFRELVYMCLDEVKLASDDAYITEDHVLFLISKYRSLALRQKYDKINTPPDDSNFQEIAVKIKAKQDASEEEVLNLISIGTPRVYTYNTDTKYQNDFPYVTKHRFKFVGHNTYLSTINYCTINTRNKLQIQKPISNTQDTTVYIWAIFDDVLKSTTYNTNEDVLDMECPIESSLVPVVQEMVVNDILSVAYRPQDTINNGADDLSRIGNTSRNKRKKN